MKVLIIGGTGIIGSAISRAATKKKYEVVSLSRKEPSILYDSIEYVYGDWTDDTFAKEILRRGFDVIVDTQIFNERQIKRSLLLAKENCKHFFYISTDSVYPHPYDNCHENEQIVIKEIKWKYGINKRVAELFLINNSSEYDFMWTIIRPTITFGDTRLPIGFSSKRGTNAVIKRIIEGKPIIRFDDKKTKHSLCHVSIFGDAVVELFMKTSSNKQSYHISDDISYSYDDIFSAIERKTKSKGNYIFIPVRYLKKYDILLYEEMIYDKNPNFTLNNNKIKKEAPNCVFHVDINECIGSTVDYILNKDTDDENYCLLTDTLLINHWETALDTKQKVTAKEYIDGIDAEYKKKLYKYGFTKTMNNNRYRFRLFGRSVKSYIKSILYNGRNEV